MDVFTARSSTPPLAKSPLSGLASVDFTSPKLSRSRGVVHKKSDLLDKGSCRVARNSSQGAHGHTGSLGK